MELAGSKNKFFHHSRVLVCDSSSAQLLKESIKKGTIPAHLTEVVCVYLFNIRISDCLLYVLQNTRTVYLVACV
jgi:hypothetical protein